MLSFLGLSWTVSLCSVLWSSFVRSSVVKERENKMLLKRDWIWTVKLRRLMAIKEVPWKAFSVWEANLDVKL